MNNLFKPAFLSFFFVFITGFVNSQTVGNCTPGNAKYMLEGENFKCMLLNQGDFFWDPAGGYGVYNWPKDGPQKRNLAFASSIWFGGKDRTTGEVVVSAQTYRQNGLKTFWPGPVNTTDSLGPIPTSDSVCSHWNHIFSITKSTIDSFYLTLENNPLPISENLIPVSVKEWPGNGNPFLATDFGSFAYTLNQDLAPFVDHDSDGVYNPEKGDYPDLGNKLAMAWWVLNDVGNLKKYNTDAKFYMGRNLEFHFMASTYPSQSGGAFLKNSVFMQVKVINKGMTTLDSCFIGLWSDLDIGNPVDDFTQCHVMKNLGFSYNGDNYDEGTSGYGVAPPVFGYKITDGPVAVPGDGIDNNRNGTIDETGEKTLFSAFHFYRVGGPSTEFGEGNQALNRTIWYRLQSNYYEGMPVKYDGNIGIDTATPAKPPCKFIFPGTSDPYGFGVGGSVQNPIAMPEWTQITAGHSPADERIIMSAGPFTLAPGQVQQYAFGTLIGYGGATNLENIEKLYSVSDSLDNLLPLLDVQKPKVPVSPIASEDILFPNPATENITIRWVDKHSAPIQIELVDILGQLIWVESVEESPTSKISLSVAVLKSGVYHILIRQKDGKKVRRKLIKP